MKSTGIVRKIDELGRIVLPIEMRRTLNIAEKDPLEIYVDGSMVILKKYIPEQLSSRRKRYICAICQREIDAAEAEGADAPRRFSRRVNARTVKPKETEE
ncbi:MAG: AbrB/MazE/SpoVT family DNA-binding domain-containing protein [Oscillospiraceae bacterium]|jgi:transcriptional pleiotropic regulator of transition state genes|nr:AbrB/MazE/SpoVT family DNA-binding domain-containing protein [Oscillospiraceae bacterium]